MKSIYKKLKELRATTEFLDDDRYKEEDCVFSSYDMYSGSHLWFTPWSSNI